MASPSTVITRGYGSWGSANLVVTLGYSSSIELPPDKGGLQFTLPMNWGGYTLPREPGQRLPRTGQVTLVKDD